MLAEIMHGEVSETQIAAFLIALRTKGETVDELAGLACTMRELAAHVPTERDDLLDTAGTGGGRRTFNVSTTAALVAAGAGCAVAKHGNRSATSSSGSADLLGGARRAHRPRSRGRRAVHRGGRLRLHVRTGPPPGHALRDAGQERAGGANDLQLARAAHQPGGRQRGSLIGVADASFLETIAGALARLGVTARARRRGRGRARRGLHLGGHPGGGGQRRGADPLHAHAREDVGIELADRSDPLLDGGSPAENAEVTRAVFAGEQERARRSRADQRGCCDLCGRRCRLASQAASRRPVRRSRWGRAAAALERYVQASTRHAPEQVPG